MENIKVFRKQEMITKDFIIGDQILVPLKRLGPFTATAYKITKRGVLFIFDECIIRGQMNHQRTNKGGYEESDLKRWIDRDLFLQFPNELRNRIIDLSIPTIGEFFGRDDAWNNEIFEMDEEEQLPLMRELINRIPFLDNMHEEGWLRNATKKTYDPCSFAAVRSGGELKDITATYNAGVRPEFWLIR